MALKNCKECGHEVSSKAEICPNCGYKNKPTQYGCLSSIVVLIGIFILIGSVTNYVDKKEVEKQQAIQTQKQKEKQQQVEQQRKQAKLQQTSLFNEKRDVILIQITQLINDGKQAEAEKIIAQFNLVEDHGLKNIKNKLREKALLAQAEKIPKHETKANRDIYRQLVSIDPNNANYKSKLNYYQGEIDKIAKMLQQQKAKEKRVKEQRLAKFGSPPEASPWDGSYFEVEKYLKRVANDPDSIDIDGCTKVYHTESGWLVGCDYRGKNAFGAVIRQSNWFTVVHGTVIQAHEASAYNP